MCENMGSFEDAVIKSIDNAKGARVYFKSVERYMGQQVRNEEYARNRGANSKGTNIVARLEEDGRS